MANLIDSSVPANSESPTLGAQRIRELSADVNTLLGIEHDISDSATTQGFHGTNVTGKVDTSIATPPSGYGRLGWKTVSGASELFYRDDAGNEKQITNAGALNIAATEAVLLTGNQTIAGNKTFSGNTTFSSAMAAAIAMGSNKITGLANGSASGDAVHFGQWTDPSSWTGTGTRVVTFPNGLIVAFGRDTSLGNATGNVAITPSGMTTALFGLVCNYDTGDANSDDPHVKTISGATVTFRKTASQSEGIQWLIIGV